MNLLSNLVLVVQVLAAVALIVLVLLQHGKGADMGAAFGSGASGSLFGATGSANFLSRLTAAMATVFFLCTLGLAFLANHRVAAPTSVMDQPAKAGETKPPASDIPAAPAAPGSSAAPAAPGAAGTAAPGAAGGAAGAAGAAAGAAGASSAPAAGGAAAGTPADAGAKPDADKTQPPKPNQGNDIPK